ncbi:hypothetical protein AB0M68_30190 [Streptomyces sp. NPDC051453]|uniref:hypothetical protein n=1 Tax=Streptomyces sp. NPDC051453 TaxID=3154941 RepID=UPI0034322D19
MFNGAAHAFALIRKEGTVSALLALLLADWLVPMAPAVHQTASHLRSGRCTKRVVSYLGMQVTGTTTFLSTARCRMSARNYSATASSQCVTAWPRTAARRIDGRDRPAGILPHRQQTPQNVPRDTQHGMGPSWSTTERTGSSSPRSSQPSVAVTRLVTVGAGTTMAAVPHHHRSVVAPRGRIVPVVTVFGRKEISQLAPAVKNRAWR